MNDMMKLKKDVCISIFVLLLILSIVISSPIKVSAHMDGSSNEVFHTIIQPVADTYVDNQSHWENKGNSYTLHVWNGHIKHISFLEFDLSSLGGSTIISAMLFLRVEVHSVESNQTSILGVHFYNESWNEYELTWDTVNWSGLNETAIDTTEIYLDLLEHQVWFNWTITQDVQSSKGSFLTEVVKAENNIESTFFSSRETSYVPYLNITYIKLPVHNIDTGLNYTTIQEAINAPETLDGHTILVDAGTYYEHVTITKSIFLLGENRNTTVIDGNGTGTVVQISTDNITVANFTIRNGGHGWSWLDSCIYGNYHSNIKIENNTVTNATNGIIFYGFFNSTMRYNFAEGLGLMGLHLDGDSTNCTIEENTVINCLEGIEIERSAGNLVEGNRLICNNASIVLNSCSGSNVLRKNNMTSDWYNLIVWGFSLEAFMHDIDTSNTLNNKTVYYITNSNNLIVDSSGYPDLGYLAVVNCTNLTIKDTDLSYNTDGLLVAQSTNCCLANITIGENRGPLLHGGLTFFRSINNSVVNSRIVNNSVGVCLYQSNNNHFYHNAFVDNDKPVISNFHSPVSPPSGSHSIAKWDNGFEGNYWSNYTGVDLDHDGIGDSEHVLDANNQDNHPLMGMFSSFNTSLGKYVDIISNSTIGDFEYFESNSTIKMFVSSMTQNQTHGFCRVCIPYDLMNVTGIDVVIDDGATTVLYPNYTLHDNTTHKWIYFAYEHSTHEIDIVPEFPSFLILPLFMIATLLAVIVYKRKHSK